MTLITTATAAKTAATATATYIILIATSVKRNSSRVMIRYKFILCFYTNLLQNESTETSDVLDSSISNHNNIVSTTSGWMTCVQARWLTLRNYARTHAHTHAHTSHTHTYTHTHKSHAHTCSHRSTTIRHHGNAFLFADQRTKSYNHISLSTKIERVPLIHRAMSYNNVLENERVQQSDATWLSGPACAEHVISERIQNNSASLHLCSRMGPCNICCSKDRLNTTNNAVCRCPSGYSGERDQNSSPVICIRQNSNVVILIRID